MRSQYAWRSQALAAVMAFLAVAILGQMVRIQTSKEAAIFRQQGKDFETELRTIYPDRGEIYDRNGHLLAGNRTVYEIGVNLAGLKDPKAVAAAVSAQLGLDYNTLIGQMTEPPAGLSYLVLADYVDAGPALALQTMKKEMQDKAPEGALGPLTGLEFKAHPQRSYPEKSLAANILGFVNREGRGYFGVEEKYNDLLAGNPVQVMVPVDPNQAVDIPHVPDGTTLVLTINRDLQAASEEILDKSLKTYGADDGTIIILDPSSGEILAMAATPRMDLNQFWDYGAVYHNATDFNPAISKPYEPGSVFKILTMAAALDNGTVTPGTSFLDTGAIMVGGATLHNWDGGAWGPQDMTGCLQHSLNVCLAWVATSLGAEKFYGYMNRFGLGHLTGVDLAGESAGRLKIPGDSDWYPVDLGTNSFGQGVAVTPLQLMMAATSIANHGRTVTPHVLHAMMREGRQYSVPPQYAGSPITAQTADTLTGMLAVSLEQESSNALVPGYRIAGKTGTAQIPTDSGYYDPSSTNASFIGWGPVDNPRFMIYVWLEKPSASIWGSQTAAPVFAEMAQKTVILLDIPPDSVRQQIAAK
ncbi:MAG TPA: penicillin-binding protein 2 [Anaerolineales bacterium]